MGEEWPGGSGSFQTTLFANSAGASDASATPDPFGPRNRGQSAASNATIRMIAPLIASARRRGLPRSLASRYPDVITLAIHVPGKHVITTIARIKSLIYFSARA